MSREETTMRVHDIENREQPREATGASAAAQARRGGARALRRRTCHCTTGNFEIWCFMSVYG